MDSIKELQKAHKDNENELKLLRKEVTQLKDSVTVFDNKAQEEAQKRQDLELLLEESRNAQESLKVELSRAQEGIEQEREQEYQNMADPVRCVKMALLL